MQVFYTDKNTTTFVSYLFCNVYYLKGPFFCVHKLRCSVKNTANLLENPKLRCKKHRNCTLVFPRPRSPCTNAECLRASRRLRIWKKNYIEEAKAVQDLREEIAQRRQTIAQQQTVQNLLQEVALLREQVAKQKKEREGTGRRVKGLAEALAKQQKVNDALEEVLVRVSQGVDPADEDMVDRNRTDGFFVLENGKEEEEWHKLLLDFQPGDLMKSDTAGRAKRTFDEVSHIIDLDPEYVPSDDDEEDTAAPPSEFFEPPIVIEAFRGLSNREPRPYWSRMVKFENAKELSMKNNGARLIGEAIINN